MKKIKYLGNGLFIILIILSIILPLFPNSVSALSAQDLSDRAKKILKLEAFEDCVNAGLDDLFPAGGSPFAKGNDAAVGHLVQPDDGVWGCRLQEFDFNNNQNDNTAREDAFFALLLKDGQNDKYYTGLYSGGDAYSLPSNNNLLNCEGDNNPGLKFRRPGTSSSDCKDFLSGNDAKDKVKSQIKRSIDKQLENLSPDDKKAMRYINLFESLTKGCNAKLVNNPNAAAGDTVKIGNETYTVNDDTALVSVGLGDVLGTNDGNLSCSNIAEQLSSLKTAYQTATGETATAPSSSASSNQAAGNAPSCEEQFGISLGWIVCGLLELLSGTIDKIFTAVDSLLSIDSQNVASSAGLRTSWGYFRAIATFSLLAIGLVMVLSQALGGGR